jgi:uncharacterized protein
MPNVYTLYRWISWSERKRSENLTKHGFDFTDAEEVFDAVTFTYEDDRFVYGEQRFVTLGVLEDTVVSIVHTEVDDAIRVISMRKATNHERKIYFESIAH